MLERYQRTVTALLLFPYSLFITASMLLLTLPILSGALLLILSDLHSNTLFFDPIFGGDPITGPSTSMSLYPSSPILSISRSLANWILRTRNTSSISP